MTEPPNPKLKKCMDPLPVFIPDNFISSRVTVTRRVWVSLPVVIGTCSLPSTPDLRQRTSYERRTAPFVKEHEYKSNRQNYKNSVDLHKQTGKEIYSGVYQTKEPGHCAGGLVVCLLCLRNLAMHQRLQS